MAIVDNTETARVLLDQKKQQVLAALLKPASANQVANRLGLPRQRVGYYVRQLEKAGLIKQVSEDRKGNCIERVLQATARQFLLAPEVTDLGDCRDKGSEMSSGNLVATAVRTIEQVIRGRELAREEGKKLPTLTLEGQVTFRNQEEQSRFGKELSELVAGLVGKYQHDDEGGRVFHINALCYPMIEKENKGAES